MIPVSLLFYGAVIVVTTLLAGAYPAFYVSRFNPSIIFRGSVKFGGNNIFSRVMLGLQLSIALITVIAGIGFARNAAFQKNYDYGYNIENTIGVVVSDTNTFAALKNEVTAIPQVASLAGTRNHIGYGHRNVVAEVQGIKKEADMMEIGRDYLNTVNLKVIEGRAFDAQMEGDYAHSILVTQKMAANYGLKDKEAVGRQVYIDSTSYSVVGVVKDYHPGQLFDPLEPVVFKLAKENRFQFLVVQAKKSRTAHCLFKSKRCMEESVTDETVYRLLPERVESRIIRGNNQYR
ncbi:MAG: ABC transporter permease [Bacteroidota bacterium]